MNKRWIHLTVLSALLSQGCALLNLTGTDPLKQGTGPLTAEQLADFESPHPRRTVVHLDTAVMSAPDSDKRLRSLIWDELDESGLMSPEDRRRLNQSGIRVGVAGGSLPWALKSLQSGRDGNSLFSRSQGPSSSFGSSVAIPEGSKSVVELPSIGQSELVIPPGEIAGLNDGATLQQARCILEMTPVEYGDGWVVIRFLPQIHHGAMTTRFAIGASGERMPYRQRIQPLYEQQFTLKLHVNETAIIGHMQQDDWTVGRLLFQTERLTGTTERLMTLQLSSLQEVNGQKALHVDYKKY